MLSHIVTLVTIFFVKYFNFGFTTFTMSIVIFLQKITDFHTGSPYLPVRISTAVMK